MDVSARVSVSSVIDIMPSVGHRLSRRGTGNCPPPSSFPRCLTAGVDNALFQPQSTPTFEICGLCQSESYQPIIMDHIQSCETHLGYGGIG